MIPGGTKRNFRSVKDSVDLGNTPRWMRTVLADAQTSGGLLLAVPESDAPDLAAALVAAGDLGAIIGFIEPASSPNVIVLR